jgi:hypothetical protein
MTRCGPKSGIASNGDCRLLRHQSGRGASPDWSQADLEDASRDDGKFRGPSGRDALGDCTRLIDDTLAKLA